MSKQSIYGVVTHDGKARPTDYLFRVSIKCIIRNDRGEVLVVKETGRDWWDIPGGGMDHGETIKEAIAREMHEEVGLVGEFEWRVIHVEDPTLLDHGFYQMRLICSIEPSEFTFDAGADADDVAFMDPAQFADSPKRTECRIFEYCEMAKGASL